MTGQHESTKAALYKALVFLVLIAAGAAGGVYGIGWWRDRAQHAGPRQPDRNFSRPPISAQNPPGPETFAPHQVVDRPPIVRGWKTVPAARADGLVRDAELVLGVEIAGETRAWPINMMTGPDREIFNDHLSGKAIAATW